MVLVSSLVLGLGLFQRPSTSRAAEEGPQTVLGPGMYVFQTRTRHASCGDAEQDGYVLTYLATIDGVPGSRTMKMELVNTKHFTEWTLRVVGKDEVVGNSQLGSTPDAADNHFEVKRDKDRFKGAGSRSYSSKVDGKVVRCRVSYDALLKRVDSL
jgi:hypothetical protein